MMKKYLFIFLWGLTGISAVSQKRSNSLTGNQTPEYDELIKHYQNLSDSFPNSRLLEIGLTDIGKPLHLFVINEKEFSSLNDLKNMQKVFLLINNGIHPGEPDGINASLLFARDLLYNKDKEFLKHCVIGIIPVYNVDGCLNRGKYSRVNQEGPEEYGFRGNARNLDLNRDFIKCDSENARSFSKLFHAFNPHLFIDTHVSNGADYQYTMTLITSQVSKLDPSLRELALKKAEPFLYDYMKTHDFPMIPYVHSIGEIPESGIMDFLETARFATGYAALFNVLGFTTETHMLKPFPQRVQATLNFLEGMRSFIIANDTAIISAKEKAINNTMQKEIFEMNYQPDTTSFEWIDFLGYESIHKPSDVTGDQRLFYDRNKPFTKKIKYFRKYNPELKITKPYCYIIPQAWHETIERLELNNVEIYSVMNDTVIEVEAYLITDYDTGNRPYEGHYLHKNINTETVKIKKHIYKGDKVIFMNKKEDRFVVETLDPSSVDSYFAWNFFDGILQQKEWFSDYVFEDLAAGLLKNDKDLKKKFEHKKNTDKSFAGNPFLQLQFVYNESHFKEKTHNLYPVFRIMNNAVPESAIIKKISWR